MIHTAEERFHDIEGRYRHACSEILSRKTLSASCLAPHLEEELGELPMAWACVGALGDGWGGSETVAVRGWYIGEGDRGPLLLQE